MSHASDGQAREAPDDALRTLAAAAFGLAGLRDGQLEGMAALAAGRDILAVMPTGYGKSAVYQVPALLLHRQLKRPTVVVSPLISLQEDQLDGLASSLGRGHAVAVNSSHTAAEQEGAWQTVERGEAAFLFLAPEQLAKTSTVERLAALNVALLVVDEAHCVSAWGHDFRPDYLGLGEVRERLGNPTTAALTATAAPPVREEILDRLRMRDPLVLVRGFDRPNISLDVIRHHEDKEKRRAVLRQAATLVHDLHGPGLVYAAKRKDTEKYAAKLVQKGLRAAAYHAGRSAAERDEVHRLFLAGDLDVVVATTTFGMGIDKPDVRFVLHADIPESLDSYYQQIGRAGRDGLPAEAVLHYRSEDLGLRRYFATHRPDTDVLLAVLSLLYDAGGPVPHGVLAAATGFRPRRLTGLLHELQDTGAVTTAGGVCLEPGADPAQVVDRAATLAAARERVDKSRIAMMRGYAETHHCRRQFLLGYFGEELAAPCGNCDNCSGGGAGSDGLAGSVVQDAHAGATGASGASSSAETEVFPLNSAVEHALWGPGLVMRHDNGLITVLFEREGYKTLSQRAVLASGLLRPLPDAPA